MKLTVQQIGLVVTIVLAAIAFAYAIQNQIIPIDEKTECEASEVYRWSDQSCYTPQGE